MARGNDRRAIFRDDLDRIRLLAILGRVAEHRSWVTYAYCLMGNHIHLLVTTPDSDLPDGMRDLLSCYARRYNTRHERTGHLFSERFRTVPVDDDAQLLATLRYIAQNPVRAGLADRACGWPWSSASRIVDGAGPVPYIATHAVLGLFHPMPRRARTLLERFVELPAPPHRPTAPTLVQLLGERQGIAAAACLGWTQAEIAAALGLGRTTVTKRLREALPGTRIPRDIDVAQGSAAH